MARSDEQLGEHGRWDSLGFVDFIIIRDFGTAAVFFGLMEENSLATILTNILNDRR